MELIGWLFTVHDVPDRIIVLVKDLIAFKKRSPHVVLVDVHVDGKVKPVGSFMTVHYHN